MDSLSSKYENVLFLGDFNCEVTIPSMSTFCDENSLKSLFKAPTCYKNPDNPKCIDLFLTNQPKRFCNTCSIETGLSDFHKMIVSVMKTSFKKLPPKIIKYRNFSKFSTESFTAELKTVLDENKNSDNCLENLVRETIKILNEKAPVKKN